jgi:hypothetical protein
MKKQVFKKLIKKLILSFFILTFFSAAGLCGMELGLVEQKYSSRLRVFTPEMEIREFISAVSGLDEYRVKSILSRMTSDDARIVLINSAKDYAEGRSIFHMLLLKSMYANYLQDIIESVIKAILESVSDIQRLRLFPAGNNSIVNILCLAAISNHKYLLRIFFTLIPTRNLTGIAEEAIKVLETFDPESRIVPFDSDTTRSIVKQGFWLLMMENFLLEIKMERVVCIKNLLGTFFPDELVCFINNSTGERELSILCKLLSERKYKMFKTIIEFIPQERRIEVLSAKNNFKYSILFLAAINKDSRGIEFVLSFLPKELFIYRCVSRAVSELSSYKKSIRCTKSDQIDEINSVILFLQEIFSRCNPLIL